MSPSKKTPKQSAKHKSKKTVHKPVSKKRVAKSKPVLQGRITQKKVGTVPALPAQGQVGAIEPTAETAKRSSPLRTNLLRALALIAVIVITVYIYSIRERVDEFATFGYPGIFFIALMANATILLPAPGVAIVYAMGAIFHPLGVGLAAGTGGALGELSGYLAGFSGQVVAERTDIYNKINPWVQKYGGWAILVLSAIPNPFFDLAGVAAGVAKMRFGKFLFFVWVGQLIKMMMFAYAGRFSIEWITKLLS